MRFKKVFSHISLKPHSYYECFIVFLSRHISEIIILSVYWLRDNLIFGIVLDIIFSISITPGGLKC